MGQGCYSHDFNLNSGTGPSVNCPQGCDLWQDFITQRCLEAGLQLSSSERACRPRPVSRKLLLMSARVSPSPPQRGRCLHSGPSRRAHVTQSRRPSAPLLLPCWDPLLPRLADSGTPSSSRKGKPQPQPRALKTSHRRSQSVFQNLCYSFGQQ